MASSGRKRRLVSSLDGEVLERLSMKLNPRMLLKDYQSLAGRLKYTYEFIRNFARERDPTLALLQHWWSSKRGKEKTVTVLIELLSDMERDDCVDLLRPYEFYSSHEASELDERRPVIAGAIDLNINPYNPNFPVRDDYQGQASGATKRDTKPSNYNSQQLLPNRRVNEHEQQNASLHGIGSSIQFEQQQRNAPVTYQQLGYSNNNTYQGQLNQKMINMRLDSIYPGTDNSAMMPSTSMSYANGSHPGSISSSMDSLQFEKHFMEYENAPPRPAVGPPYQSNEIPSFQPPVSPDEFHGARRDLRLHEKRNRPHLLDGSSISSSEERSLMGVPKRERPPGITMQRDFIGPPRHNMMMGGIGADEPYIRTGGDMRYWPRDVMGYKSTAAAAADSVTVAADKVALVIGNRDYAHQKLRGLLYPEKDAADVAQALTNLNFKVISLVNLTLSEMRTAMLAFCCLLGKGVYGVVYYAGHGYEDNGENYLLPVDSDLKYNREKSLRTQEILDAMQQCDTSLNLLIIDSCRVSLPNKTGTVVPRMKRYAKGNNIFAFSCCSQQESLEKVNCRNGMYCTHLLRRIRENRRVEYILMDVATDFAKAYNLPQQPCMETDTRDGFRLTDPIEPEPLEQEYRERCRRWMEAKRHPQGFSVTASSLQISLDFEASFSNVLCVTVITEKRIQKSVKEFHLKLETVEPLVCKLVDLIDVNEEFCVCQQTFEIQNIQKHIKLQGPVMLTIKAGFKEDNKLCQYEKEIDIGWPLVSSITCLWDSWLLGDRYKSTSV